jgi:hypothetical protein
LARAQWLDDRRSELLDIGYFHVVFTVPEPISAIAYQNKQQVWLPQPGSAQDHRTWFWPRLPDGVLQSLIRTIEQRISNHERLCGLA